MDIRDVISEAYDEHAEEEEKPENEEEEKQEKEEEEKPEEEEKEEEEKEEPEAKEEEEKPEEEEEEEKPEEKEGEQEAKKEDDEPSEEEQPARQAARAPQSWKPEVRAHWSKLPAEVQAEVTRREVEISRTLTNTANARRLAAEFTRVVQPYEGLIRMQRSTPLQAVQNMMQTAAVLQMGTAAQKAKAIVQVIQSYGVDIETLDKMLAGENVNDTTAAIDSRIRQHMAPVNELLSRMTQSEQREAVLEKERVEQEIEVFANDPKNSYFEDVREDIADLMDMAESRGRKLTLATAYQMALQNRPDLLKLAGKPNGAPTVENKSISRKKIEKAKAAASSVSSSSAPSGKKKSVGSVRSAVEDAWEQSSAR